MSKLVRRLACVACGAVASCLALAHARPLPHPQRRDHRPLRARRLDRHRRAHRRAEAAGAARPDRSSCSTGRAPAAPSASPRRCAPRPTATRSMNSYTAEAVVVPQISKTAQIFGGGRLRADRDHRPRAGGADGVEERQGRQPARTSSPRCAPIPGKYTYGGGYGSPPHVMGAWMNKLRGLNVQHVPYRGGAQGINDVVGGHIDMFYGGVAAGKGRDRQRLGQGDRGDRRHALLGAAERADLQGGRRAGVRSGELDRDAGAEGHADRHRRR